MSRLDQITVKVDRETLLALDKMALNENISRANLIRRFITKGLSIKSYEQELNTITAIIRQEIQSTLNVNDFKDSVERQAERIIKVLVKSAKLSCAEYFLLLRLLDDCLPGEVDLDSILANAQNEGMKYMHLKDIDVNNYLRDVNGHLGIAQDLGKK